MNEWYNIKIFGKEVNWASVVASGVIFLGLELYRRKNMRKQVKDEVKREVTQLARNQNTSNDNIIDTIINQLT